MSRKNNTGIQQVIGSYGGPTDILPPGPDTQYLNLVVPPRNPNVDGNIPASYISQFSQPILYNPQDYLMAMVRFQISGINIPLLIPRIQPFPNVNINNTIYSVSIGYNGAFSPQQYVQFVQTDFTDFVPAPPTALNPNVVYTPYYFVYEYTDFIMMVNTALAAAFAATPGIGGAATTAPYFIFDPISQRISLIAPQAAYDLTTGAVALPVTVYVNTPLFRFFDGIPIIDRASNSATGRDIQFNIRNLNNSNWYQATGPAAPAYPYLLLQMQQEYDALADWNCLQNVQLQSATLPINKEVVPSIRPNNQGEITSLGILSDFIPLVTKGPEFRTDISYVANGSFRYIDMLGQTPITKADLSFYWVDELGEQRLIYTPPNKLATAKILFIKKDLVGSIALTG